jgi:hypothetical protein
MRGARPFVVCVIAGGLGGNACALITQFDPAVSPDAGVADAGTEGCASSTALLCEDFENGFDSSKWTDIVQTGGTALIDGPPDPVHSGLHSLHLNGDPVDADANDTTIVWRTLAHQWPATLFVRAFLYWDSPLAGGVTNNLELQNADRSKGFVLYTGQGGFGWTNWGDNVSRTTPVIPATGEWTCVEWSIDGTTGDVEVSVDGVPNPALSDTTTPTFPFTELDIGMAYTHDQAEPTMDAWMDDVVLDDKPIGCAH